MNAQRQVGPTIAIPEADARLTYVEELAKGFGARVFLWIVQRGDQARPVRIELEDLASWVIAPTPSTDADRRRAAAQLAAPRIANALMELGFFDADADFDVRVDTFHPPLNDQGQLVSDPIATPYLN